MSAFDGKIAEICGIRGAVVFEFLKNEMCRAVENQDYVIGGKAWIKKSAESFHQSIPYITASQIREELVRLEKYGLIESQSFDKKRWDQTKSYRITDLGYQMAGDD